MTQRDVRGGRWELDSGLGTRVHPWQNHVDVWQNQYNTENCKMGFPGGPVVKSPPCNAMGGSFISGPGRSHMLLGS